MRAARPGVLRITLGAIMLAGRLLIPELSHGRNDAARAIPLGVGAILIAWGVLARLGYK